MEKTIIQAAVRKDTSKLAVKELRRKEHVPGVFYLKGEGSIPVSVEERDINPVVFTNDTHVIDLKLDDGREFECIVKDTQFDPLTDKVIHFDLLGLVRGQKITLEVPVLYRGSAVGVREGGLLQEFTHKLEVNCLPKDIPDHIELDISEMKIGDTISVADLSYENLEFQHSDETILVTVTPPKSIEDEGGSEEMEEAVEPEVISKGKEEDSEE